VKRPTEESWINVRSRNCQKTEISLFWDIQNRRRVWKRISFRYNTQWVEKKRTTKTVMVG